MPIYSTTIYTTKTDTFVCPPHISETAAVRIMKLAHVSFTYCLDNEENHFKTNFTVHFINFILNNLNESGHDYPKHRPEIALYYIIFSTGPCRRNGLLVRERDWQSSTHGFESH